MRMVSEADIEKYKASLEDEFPGLRILDSKPWWLRAAAKILPKQQLLDRTQTIGNTIYLARNWSSYSLPGQLIVLSHERAHLLQFRKYGLFLMSFLYLLVFFPIGLAYFRARFERAGFREGMRRRAEIFGLESQVRTYSEEQYLDNLCGQSYLWAWPFKKMVKNWFIEDWTEVLKENGHVDG